MKMSNPAAVLENAIGHVKEKNPQVGASLERWDRSLSASGKSPSYRLFLVNHVKRFLAWNDWRLEPKRMEAFFLHLSEAQVPFEERKGCARSLKLFLRHTRKPLPAILKTRLTGRPKQLVRTDLLSGEEIQALIDVGQRPRDKALVAVLYDSGARIEEVASLRYEDVRPHPDYPNAFIVVIRKSKTQERENVLFEAFPYLRDYLNVHPTKKPGPLWLGQMNGRPFEPFTKAAIANLIRGLVKRAKDDGRIARHRRIWPHLFRHTRATRLLEMGYGETKLKQRMGWTLASSMLSRYVHLASEGYADEEAKVHGIEVVTKKHEEGLRHRVCPSCEAPNAPGNAYCTVCGEALDAEERKARIEERTQQFLELLESNLSPEGKRMVTQLQSGRPLYPPEVEKTLQQLEERGIEVTVAADTIELDVPEKAEVTEAALGNARFALLVTPEVETRVAEIAQRNNFPGPVFAGKAIGKSTKAKTMLLASNAPEWLVDWTNTVTLLEDGKWRDERGLWVSRPTEQVLGKRALMQELRKAEGDLDQAKATVNAGEGALSAARVAKEETSQLVAQLQERERILGEVQGIPDARKEAASAVSSLHVAMERLDAATSARESATRGSNEATGNRIRRELELQQHEVRLAGEREALARTEEAAALKESQLREKRVKIREDLKLLAEAEKLEAPSTLLRDLEAARADFAAAGDPPKLEVREEAKNMRVAVEELEAHVKTRKEEQEAARVELTECRKRYLGVVDSSMQDYRRRVQELAQVAEAVVEMELPRLEDDDHVLDEAGIGVSFGFDGKDPVPLGDPTFSGGQQVIAGLVLLMAMAETDGEGFFILDEPFAHLSLDRVDHVGRFLRGTKSQFIITAPTTLDRAQLDPASMLIVLRKKKPAEQFAPVPIVAEA